MTARRGRALALAVAAAAAGFALPAGATGGPARGLAEIELPAPARAARVGVVIGNGAYAAAAPLANAVGDAQAFAAFLRGHGFAVHEGYDLDKRGFERLLRAVLQETDPGSEVVLFYAGHGIQIGRRNYLLPVDADLREPSDVPFETVSLDRMIALLGGRSKLQLMLLDSCRENPFAGARLMAELDATLFETGAGFEPVAAPINTLLSYSTSPGQLALDGPPGAGSPYARALLETAAAAPDRPVDALLGEVRRRVYALTEGRQVPWESSTLVEPFAFLAAGPEPAPTLAAAPPDAAAALAALDGREIALDLALGRSVALGPALAAALDLPEGATARLADAPMTGRLRAGDAVLEPGAAVDPAALAYDPALPFAPARPALEDHAVRDGFTLEIALGGATARASVALTLAMDPCDWRAGAQYDPQGLGVDRLPNELAPEAALAACDAAVAADPSQGRFHYQRARALIALRRTGEAREALERSIALGHVRGLAGLAALLHTEANAAGGAVAAQRAGPEARALMASGAAAGDPLAKHLFGRELLRHGETEAERAQGFALLSEAVEVGHTYAMNELGFYFATQEGPDATPERGLRYLRESAARGDVYGLNNLGFLHLRGLAGLPQDDRAAFERFRLAAEGGHPGAPANLGRMLARGVAGGAPDPAEAVRWYDLGLARGDGWGGANAAWLIANRGAGGLGPGDAAARAAKAATLRNAEAAAAAGAVLDGLDARALDAGAQTILRELGEPVAVDGRAGPRTRDALDRRRAALGLGPAPADPRGRLIAAAEAFWRASPLRLDLF